MAVTTRSATRASVVKPKKTIRKRVLKKQKHLPAVNNTIAKTNGKSPSLAKMPPGYLQWISLKDPSNGVIPNSDEIFTILQEIQKLRECIGIARGRPHGLSDIEWLIIEWRSNRDREEFLTSKLSLTLNEALASRPWSQEVAPLLNPIGHIIVANSISLPQTIYEVLTIYFPTDLDQKTISSIEKFRGLPCFNIEPENLPENPWGALVTNFPVMWKEGTCEYQGITAKRLVWFIEFFNMEGERIFKEKTRRYNARGRLVSDVMGDFFGKLEDLGMIGHESIHVSFLEVVHDFPENYVSEHCVPGSLFPSFGKLPPECFEDFPDL